MIFAYLGILAALVLTNVYQLIHHMKVSTELENSQAISKHLQTYVTALENENVSLKSDVGQLLSIQNEILSSDASAITAVEEAPVKKSKKSSPKAPKK
jgi:hypothetical protein